MDHTRNDKKQEKNDVDPKVLMGANFQEYRKRRKENRTSTEVSMSMNKAYTRVIS